MILVLLGTQNNNFHRLLDEIERCIDDKTITDKVIVQAGHTRYVSNKMEILDFVSMDKFNELIQNADLIITHGGVGSILNSIKAGKKVIAIPRLKKYKEHINDHQIQIVNAFDSKNYIKGIFDMQYLRPTLKTISEFVPCAYINNGKNILKIVSEYIDNN